MNIPNKEARTILESIPDRKQRDKIADILTGKITKRVRCLSKDLYEKHGKKKTLVRKGCDGRIIANIYSNNKIRLAASEGKGWLRAFVHRLDGATGFQCWCGNDSRSARQEKPVVAKRGSVATKEYIEDVMANVVKSPSNYPIKDNIQIVDGFAIERIG